MTVVCSGQRVFNERFPFEAGTVGFVFTLKSDKSKRFIVSCAHVLAPEGATVGDPIMIGSETGASEVAVLKGFGGRSKNRYDASDVAFAEIVSDKATANAKIDDTPFSVTGRTALFVPGLSCYAKGHDDPHIRIGKIQDFSNGRSGGMILIRQDGVSDVGSMTLGNPGDSGSVVVNRFGRAIGIIQSRKKSTPEVRVIPIGTALRIIAQHSSLGLEDLEFVPASGHVDIKKEASARV